MACLSASFGWIICSDHQCTGNRYFIYKNNSSSGEGKSPRSVRSPFYVHRSWQVAVCQGGALFHKAASSWRRQQVYCVCSSNSEANCICSYRELHSEGLWLRVEVFKSNILYDKVYAGRFWKQPISEGLGFRAVWFQRSMRLIPEYAETIISTMWIKRNTH